MTISKWDMRFLALAEYKAQWSKDPKTKVGCVIATGNQDKFYGYNGFPPSIEDTPERLENYEVRQQLTVHAEMNAIITANERLWGHTLYCTRPTCIRCAVIIIRAGITRVVCYGHTQEKLKQHHKEYKFVGLLYKEANIRYEIYTNPNQ